MKKLLASTALVAITALPLYAQTAADPSAAPATPPAATETAPAASGEVGTMGSGADSSVAATDDAAGTGTVTAATDLDPARVTAEQLQGADVFGPNDEKVGSVSDVVIAQDGKITEAVVDLGGFLGIGAKPVAFNFDELRMTSEDPEGSEVKVHVSQDQAALEAMPEYQGEG